ncbi:MAG: TonB-dependent receptor [Flavobacteriaceae bacterium]|nr:TonB-dependent receptor [Flavobacteriaceae bacterium]
MKQYIFWILLCFAHYSIAQEVLKGQILDKNNQAIFGANIYWLETQLGTTSNETGTFSIPTHNQTNRLIISYIGFETDTITINNLEFLKHRLREQGELKEVVITEKKKSLGRSYFKPKNVITVNKSELLKAACCNLAESFETNPSIDVSVSDAITGTKQIQMLGLKSPYLLISQEGIPYIRGASQAFGLSFVPGTWINSIAITKGAGSVLSGYESISGQINTNLVAPNNDKKFFVNAYGSLNGRIELNTHVNQSINENWQSGLYLHSNIRERKVDQNDDGFLDSPLARQFNLRNKWVYTDTEKGWVGGLNLQYVYDKKQTGQIDFLPSRDKNTDFAWGSEIKTERIEAAANVGYVWKDMPFQSLGVQTSFNIHDQDSYFGYRPFQIQHNSFYSNVVFSSIIGDTRNKFTTGINFTHDKYEEMVASMDYSRRENNIGAYLEYAYDNIDNLSFTLGLRLDHHNLLGTFLTPRVHMRFAPWGKAALRVSGGKGKRSPNIFTENIALFSTNRNIHILENNGSFYGLDGETAWNYGISFMQGFDLWNQKGDIAVDYYQTRFKDQVVVDWEDPASIRFYNLDGRSFANNLQIELNYNITKKIHLRTAYKHYDTQTQYMDKQTIQPLQAKHRYFANISIETTPNEAGAQWKFDTTYNWIGQQRLPRNYFQASTSADLYSNSYNLINAQITKIFNNGLEVYLGGENLGNIQQDQAIIGADNPFGIGFDSSLAYAPVMGRMFYAGLRFGLE